MSVRTSDVQSSLRGTWRKLPVPIRLAAGKVIGLATASTRSQALPSATHNNKALPGPLIVSGFLSEVLGIGRGARLTISALRQAGLVVNEHDIGIRSPDFEINRGRGGVWILHCNPVEAEPVLLNMPLELWSSRYRIGYWAWEQPKLPRSWIRLARLYHEIWTPSEFVARSVRPHARCVRVMPHYVSLRPTPSPGRQPNKSLRIVVMADARSTLSRKNPAGAVEAFCRAFPTPSDDIQLVIKIVAPQADPLGMQDLFSRVGRRSDIEVIVRALTDEETQSFLAKSDIVVSLHRAEGFGLVLAEAMALSKPVVATGWSGNMDFMGDSLRDVLVPYQMERVRDPTGRYKGGFWAEPDITAASQIIRRLARDPAERARIGDIGSRAVALLQKAWCRESLGADFLAHLDKSSRGGPV